MRAISSSVMLKLDAYALKHLLPVLSGIHAQNFRGAGIRRLQPQDQVDGGAFAGSVVPQQRKDLALFHVEGQVIHHGTVCKGFCQVSYADSG